MLSDLFLKSFVIRMISRELLRADIPRSHQQTRSQTPIKFNLTNLNLLTSEEFTWSLEIRPVPKGQLSLC